MEDKDIRKNYESPAVKVYLISTGRAIICSPNSPGPGENEEVGYDDWGV